MLQTTNLADKLLARGRRKPKWQENPPPKQRVGSTPTSGTTTVSRTGRRLAELCTDLRLRAYVIGVAIGDGNLSNPNRRAVRLRITCDTKYPALISKIRSALERLLPQNRVSVVASRGNYVNLSVYSNHLETLLGWHASGGSKHHQRVQVPPWVCEDVSLSAQCLQGLIETDGSIYTDRGYQMVIFSTVIAELAEQVELMMRTLGFRPHLYKVRQDPAKGSFKYQVRLSRDVAAFLRLVRPLKG